MVDPKKYAEDMAEFERLTGQTADKLVGEVDQVVEQMRDAGVTVGPVQPDLLDKFEAAVAPSGPPPFAPSHDLDDLDRSLSPFRYLGGAAGSGKSFAIRERAAELENMGKLAITSTTGIAAINLDGTTINSLLGYFDTQDLQNSYTKGWLQAKLRRLRNAGVRTIVLDEVSMMDGRQLTVITRALDEVNRKDNYEAYLDEINSVGDADESWMGLLLVGDFCQLPPVKAPFAFQSPEWGRYEANAVALNRIWRQDDPAFIEALRATRRGEPHKALEFFRELLQDRVDNQYPGPTILAKNEEVERVNRMRLDDLAGKMESFESSRWGKERGEWKNIPEKFEYKVGAKVMLLANKRETDEDGRPTGNYLYINGDIGTIVDLIKLERPAEEGMEKPPAEVVGAEVKLERNQRVVGVQPIVRQNLKPLDPGRLSELKATAPHLIKNVWDPDTKKWTPEYEILGEIDYMPMRIAYATTVHKSQGLSLSTVQVNISNPFFSNPGSLYVALSRARSAAGLRLVGTPEQFINRCVTDPKVARFL